jgi:hypothetical protein
MHILTKKKFSQRLTNLVLNVNQTHLILQFSNQYELLNLSDMSSTYKLFTLDAFSQLIGLELDRAYVLKTG